MSYRAVTWSCEICTSLKMGGSLLTCGILYLYMNSLSECGREGCQLHAVDCRFPSWLRILEIWPWNTTTTIYHMQLNTMFIERTEPDLSLGVEFQTQWKLTITKIPPIHTVDHHLYWNTTETGFSRSMEHHVLST